LIEKELILEEIAARKSERLQKLLGAQAASSTSKDAVMEVIA
jgi:hypothetical protein